MKTRHGYVSNSSSSSFLVYGNEIRDEDALETAFDEGRHVICVDVSGGTSGDAAACVFDVTRERYGIIRKMLDHFFDSRLKLIDAAACAYPDDNMVEFVNCRGGKVWSFMKDENSPSSNAVNDRDFREWLGRFDDEQLDGKCEDSDDDMPFMLFHVLSFDDAVGAVKAGRNVWFVIEGYTAVMYKVVGSAPDDVKNGYEIYRKHFDSGTGFFSDFMVSYRYKANVDLPDGKYRVLYGDSIEVPIKVKSDEGGEK